jgi:nitrogenase subunit NifH
MIQNKPRIIPHMYSGFRLYANQTSGKRLLVALLVNNPDQLSVLESALPSAFKEAIQKYAYQLDQKLIQVLQQKNVVSNAEYSIATVNYEVIN